MVLVVLPTQVWELSEAKWVPQVPRSHLGSRSSWLALVLRTAPHQHKNYSDQGGLGVELTRSACYFFFAILISLTRYR
jgi:hypothetical protein